MVYIRCSIIFGTDLKALANQLIVAGVAFAAITAYLILYPPVFFPIMTASYDLIIWLLAIQIYAGEKAPWLVKLNGVILIVEAFITVLYPTLAIAMGIPLP